MALDVNYRQIMFVREYRGLSQTELASKIKGLSQSNLSKYEKGVGSLSDEIILKIIDLLEFPYSFYENNISNKVEHAHYRRKASVTKKERTEIEYSNKLVGYIIDQMSHTVEFPDYSIPDINLEDGYTPESVAKFIRKFFNLKNEPVKDIFSLLESHGIIVVELDYDVDVFDGVSFCTDEGFRVIIINKNFSNDHKRLTLAHELGHVIMHLSPKIPIPDFRDREDEAYRFASEFLMPKDDIINSLRNLKLQHLIELKRYWLTSMSSIIYRANKLKCIDNNKYTYFNIELSRKGYKKEEPINVYIDEPILLNQAYELFKNDLNYSDEDLSKAFSIPSDILKTYCVKNNNKVKLKLYKI